MGLDAERVHKPVRKLRKLLKDLPKQPTPEQVHQLRTNIRRIEPMLASLSLDRQERRLLKNIASIRRKAGGVRDMDVLISYVPAIRSTGEEQCRAWLLEHLGVTRRKQAKKLHAKISRGSGKARAALKRVDRRLEAALCENREKNCDSMAASSQATASALVLESGLRQPIRLTRKNLHPYRLKVKQLQNVLRLAEDSNDGEFLKALAGVKDAIGEWHDWEELFGIAQEVLDHGSKCQLRREIRNLCERKYAAALAEAQKMRRRYLNISPGKANGGLQHAAKPVWQANAAMAA
jgi:CHAD domain-containing protein